MRIRIRNGRIIDPAAGVDRQADLFIADKIIAAVGRSPPGFQADREIDASGKWVLPGLVDLCARLREPGAEHKATIASECAAAVAGGVTSLCFPPDTDPVIDTPAVVELIHRRARAARQTRVYALGALTHALAGERLAEMHALKRAGCLAVTNAGHPVTNSEVLRRAMEYAASCELPVFLHAEDYDLRNGGVVHEGAISTRLGLPPIPAAAETVAVSRALMLAECTGARVHFCRLSAARSVALIAEARKAGLPVSADVGICNLRLTVDDVIGYESNCHLNPPLRTLADQRALRQALADGTIDAVCSDHQPHDLDAKSAPFSMTEPGASTIELLLPLLFGLVHDGTLPLMRAVAAITQAPADILGIEAGTLAMGAPADVVVVDAQEAYTVRAQEMRSAGKNTPFAGWEVAGKISHTLVGGRVVFGT